MDIHSSKKNYLRYTLVYSFYSVYVTSTRIVLFPERLSPALCSKRPFQTDGALRCLRQDGRRGGAAEVTQRQHGEEVGRDIGDVREEDETCDMNNMDVRTRERDE